MFRSRPFDWQAALKREQKGFTDGNCHLITDEKLLDRALAGIVLFLAKEFSRVSSHGMKCR